MSFDEMVYRFYLLPRCWELKLKILGVEYENSRRRGERDDVATDEEDSESTYHFGVIKGTKKKITREKREIRIAFKITKIVSLELLKQQKCV